MMPRSAPTLLLPGMVLLAAPAPAAPQSATADGAAQAEVVAPLVVTSETDLAFGSIFAGSTAGTVTVSDQGEASYAGGAQPACIEGACISAHAARFSVTGEAGRTYVVAVPGGIIATGTALDGSGAMPPPLSVGGISVRTASRPGNGGNGQLDAAGRDRFDVGGVLSVPAGLPSASYRATIPVVVTYD